MNEYKDIINDIIEKISPKSSNIKVSIELHNNDNLTIEILAEYNILEICAANVAMYERIIGLSKYTINNYKINTIRIKGGIFNKLTLESLPENICFTGCIFNYIYNVPGISFELKNTNFKSCYFNSIKLTDPKIIKTIHLEEQTINSLIIESSKSIVVQKEFSIQQCNINKIELDKIDVHGEFLLSGNRRLTKTLIKYIISLNPDNKLFLLEQKIEIENCIFRDNFYFEDNNLESDVKMNSNTFYKNALFRNSNIRSIKLKKSEFDSTKDINFSNFDIQYVSTSDTETYRIIKYHLEKNHNKIDANKFHSYELKSAKINLYKDNIGKNFDKLITFTLNEFVSEHGLKWHLPLFWIFYIGMLFSTYYMSTNYIEDLHSSEYMKRLLVTASLFLYEFILFLAVYRHNDSIEAISKVYDKYYFLNRSIYLLSFGYVFELYIYVNGTDFEPLLRFFSVIDFSNQENISFEAKNISRVIMGYLIYHLIVALRKDTRR